MHTGRDNSDAISSPGTRQWRNRHTNNQTRL